LRSTSSKPKQGAPLWVASWSWMASNQASGFAMNDAGDMQTAVAPA
jgi:hypothetical protein